MRIYRTNGLAISQNITILEQLSALPLRHSYQFPGHVGFTDFTDLQFYHFSILLFYLWYHLYRFSALAGFTIFHSSQIAGRPVLPFPRYISNMLVFLFSRNTLLNCPKSKRIKDNWGSLREEPLFFYKSNAVGGFFVSTCNVGRCQQRQISRVQRGR